MVKTQDIFPDEIHTVSMTGFASLQGAGLEHDWTWDLRSVNGKGLDLRLRVPDLTGLEVGLRKALAQVAARGNIQLSLKLARQGGSDALRVNSAALEAALNALIEVNKAATGQGLAMAPSTPAEILTLRGVLEQGAAAPATPDGLVPLLLADAERVLAQFHAMRRAEGAELGRIIAVQIDRIAELTEEAEARAQARRPEAAVALRAALARVMDATPTADKDRIAQELALLAVKADITEEIDRLRAHITAARALLADPGPVGRKFEFLAQEFVRETNTLCSKSNDSVLTRIGLDLKYVIDQMREQIQNVE